MDRYGEEKTVFLWGDNSQKKLVLVNLQSGEKFSFTLKDSCVLGRYKPFCDVQITTRDRYISGKHLCFEKKGDEVYIKDLNSKNGTWLNGQRISSNKCVHQGDILKIGRSEFKIQLG